VKVIEVEGKALEVEEIISEAKDLEEEVTI
jgi:hypothetical protein